MDYANTYPGVNSAALEDTKTESALRAPDVDGGLDDALFTRVAGAAALRNSVEAPDGFVDHNREVNAFSSAMQSEGLVA